MISSLISKPDSQVLCRRFRPQHKTDLAVEPITQAGLNASTTTLAFVNLWPQNAGFARQA